MSEPERDEGASSAGRERWLLLGLLSLLFGVIRLRPVVDTDLMWHLDQGMAVLQHGAARYVDDTSFTLPGQLYTNHIWLADLFWYGVWSALGWSGCVGVVAVFAALSTWLTGMVAFAFARVAEEPRRLGRALVVTSLVGVAASWRFEPRPQCFMFVFVPAALLLAQRWVEADGVRRRRMLAAAIAIMGLLWAQLHSSYILLPAIVALALVGELQSSGPRAVARRAALPLALALLPIATIGGLRYFAWLADIGLGDATSYIAEMKPITLRDLLPTELDSILALDLLLVVAAGRSYQARKLRLDDGGRGLLGLALALTARRFVAAWALLVTPWAARHHEELEDLSPRWPRGRRVAALLIAVALPGLAALDDLEDSPMRGFGVGLHRDYVPVDAARLLSTSGLEGKLFNEYDDGGYLAFSASPRVLLAIDGRTPNFYDTETFYLVRMALHEPAAFEALTTKHRPDMALLFRERALCKHLTSDPRWRAVFVDERRTLFVTEPTGADLPPLRLLDPCAPVPSIGQRCAELGAEAKAPLGEEIDALIAASPEAPYPRLLRAHLELACKGDPGVAVDQVETALASGTRHPDAYNVLAQARAVAGQLDRALRAADQAVASDPGTAAREIRGRLRRRAGDAEGAVDDLRAVVDRLGDETDPMLRLELARALADSGERRQARLQAQRALWSGGGPRAAKLLDELGASQE